MDCGHRFFIVAGAELELTRTAFKHFLILAHAETTPMKTNGKLVDKVDVVFLNATDYSPIK